MGGLCRNTFYQYTGNNACNVMWNGTFSRMQIFTETSTDAPEEFLWFYFRNITTNEKEGMAVEESAVFKFLCLYFHMIQKKTRNFTPCDVMQSSYKAYTTTLHISYL